MHEASDPIVVLGAGPAGAAAALGLAALGFEVVAVAAPGRRTRPQRESFSVRVVGALRGLGVEAALSAVEPPGARLVHWAGETRELAGEAQVERAAFDAGLLADLARRGVRIARDEALGVTVGARARTQRVSLASGATLDARFVVDARGRAAPSGVARARGPETLCVVQRWRRTAAGSDLGGAPSAHIAIASLAAGWAWLADDGRGGLTTQLALDTSDVPARAALAAHSEAALRDDAFCRELLGGALRVGEPLARAATPVLAGALANERMLRVGDAALAVDPLSGNGVFQALSTALVAPAVVNTLLRAPERTALARTFYAERARDLFLRFAHVSRDFYAQGSAHHGSEFWKKRAAWPEAEDARERASALRTAPAIALRPVVRDGWIVEREVVITPERPLGTWQVAGVEVAPLVRGLAAAPDEREPQRAAREARALAALPEVAREPVRAWLREHAGARR